MGNKIDLAKERFDWLVVIKESGRSSRGEIMWECCCDCGNTVIARSSSLRCGHTKSCGCYNDQVRKSPKTHGLCRDALYCVWGNMISRCYNQDRIGYANYGGRGITVCDEWKRNAKKFIDWAKKHGWQKDLQIDRFDNEQGYSPSNCRFVIRSKNSLNTRLLQARNTTGFRGVRWHKRAKKYTANLQLNKKNYYFGLFLTAIEAARARDAFVIKNNIHTPLNFPQDVSVTW